jgi:hypothetical protein
MSYWQFALAAFAFTVLGCSAGGSAASPPPAMPSFSTHAGNRCARECQRSWTDCKAACPRSQQLYLGKDPTSSCFDTCGQVLKDCYHTCE